MAIGRAAGGFFRLNIAQCNNRASGFAESDGQAFPQPTDADNAKWLLQWFPIG